MAKWGKIPLLDTYRQMAIRQQKKSDWEACKRWAERGLALYGESARASELTLKTVRLLANGLAQQGQLHECYDDLGRGLWPDQGSFISWNLLALTLLDEMSAQPAG